MSHLKQVDKFYFNNPDTWESLRSKSIHQEINFLIETIKKYNPNTQNILDVGCGTGIHCFELSKLGYKTTGVDLNKNMINYAKQKYPHLKFHLLDMHNLDAFKKSLRKFDLIICLRSTINYCLTYKEINNTLNSFSNLLKKNGLLIIDFFNALNLIKNPKYDTNFFHDKKRQFQKIHLKSKSFYKVDMINQILIEKREIYDTSNNPSIEISKLKIFFPNEMKMYLENNGFMVKIIELGYNYASEFKTNKYIFISQKT